MVQRTRTRDNSKMGVWTVVILAIVFVVLLLASIFAGSFFTAGVQAATVFIGLAIAVVATLILLVADYRTEEAE